MSARRAVVLACCVLALPAAGCGEDDDGGTSSGPLTVYSGREEELVEPLLAQFEKRTGIDLEVRYGDSAELAAQIAEEGENSPADVFFAQDAGTLGAVAGDGRLAELPGEALERVPARFRDPGGRWVGTSGRARVVVFNTEQLEESDLPTTIWGFADPRWKGKIGIPPTNASFQAFVTAMRLTAGEERTRAWLEALQRNEPKLYEKNTPVVEAVADGEIEVGLVNHYYVYLVKEERPDAPVANQFLTGGDPGALVNAAGVGIVEGTDQRDDAERFVEYLLSAEGQRFYAKSAEEAEYPLVAGIEPRPGLPPLASIQGPDVALGDLGPELERTLELLNELGYTT